MEKICLQTNCRNKLLNTLKILGIDSYLIKINDVFAKRQAWIHDQEFNVLYMSNETPKLFPSGTQKKCYSLFRSKDAVCECCKDKELTCQDLKQCALCKRGTRGLESTINHTVAEPENGKKLFLKTSYYLEDIYNLMKDTPEGRSYLNWDKMVYMCANCRCAKESDSQWVEVDNDLIEAMDIPISHGICPECIQALYPELVDSLMGSNLVNTA